MTARLAALATGALFAALTFAPASALADHGRGGGYHQQDYQQEQGCSGGQEVYPQAAPTYYQPAPTYYQPAPAVQYVPAPRHHRLRRHRRARAAAYYAAQPVYVAPQPAYVAPQPAYHRGHGRRGY